MDEDFEKQLKKVISRTKSRMKKVGTYKPEFDASVERYADLTVQYEILKRQWYGSGCAITEEYTNKSGAVNERKTPVYMAMETLRKDLIEMENIFGLTPKGLKQIRSKSLEGKKESALGQALKELDGQV